MYVVIFGLLELYYESPVTTEKVLTQRAGFSVNKWSVCVCVCLRDSDLNGVLVTGTVSVHICSL